MAVEAKGASATAWNQGLPWAFVDGAFISADDAGVSIHAHALSYGTGTFEGIRGSWSDSREELYLLEPEAHYARMQRSASVLGLELPYLPTELVEITRDLARRNEVRSDLYVRPLYVLTGEVLTVRIHDVRARFSIAMSSISGAYVGASGGARCTVSAWRRAPDAAVPSRAKLTGSYVGPAIAKSDAARKGFDEAIMLNVDGHVTEATTSNLFMRRGAAWVTPGPEDDILEGVTRRQLMTLLEEEGGHPVTERSIDASELFVCDELLLSGTAAQVVPVVEVDGRLIGGGNPGEMTTRMASLLSDISRRASDRHHEWTVAVYGPPEGNHG